MKTKLLKDDAVTIHDAISLPEFSSNTNLKRPMIVAFLNFSSVMWTETFDAFMRSVDEKHLMRFQNETSVFKFQRRSVDGALEHANEDEIISSVYISSPQSLSVYPYI